MTKEDWKYIQKQQEVPIHVWYEYYKENGGVINSISEFQHIFDQVIMSDVIINGKRTNFVSALNRLYHFYNNKFS